MIYFCCFSTITYIYDTPTRFWLLDISFISLSSMLWHLIINPSVFSLGNLNNKKCFHFSSWLGEFHVVSSHLEFIKIFKMWKWNYSPIMWVNSVTYTLKGQCELARFCHQTWRTGWTNFKCQGISDTAE